MCHDVRSSEEVNNSVRVSFKASYHAAITGGVVHTAYFHNAFHQDQYLNRLNRFSNSEGLPWILQIETCVVCQFSWTVYCFSSRICFAIFLFIFCRKSWAYCILLNINSCSEASIFFFMYHLNICSGPKEGIAEIIFNHFSYVNENTGRLMNQDCGLNIFAFIGCICFNLP